MQDLSLVVLDGNIDNMVVAHQKKEDRTYIYSLEEGRKFGLVDSNGSHRLYKNLNTIVAAAAVE